MKPEKTICLKGGSVVTADRDDTILEHTDVWIQGGTITHLLPAGSPAPYLGDVETIDVGGHAVMPGMVNAHSHSASAIQRSQGHGEPLDLFVMQAIARRSRRDARTVYVGAAIHAAEMLKAGVTGVIDHLRHGLMPSFEAVDAALTAYRDTGIRARVAPMYEDRIYLESMPIDLAQLPAEVRAKWFEQTQRPPFEQYFEVMDALRNEWADKDERLGLLLGVDGPQRCTQALLERTGDYARQHGIGLHTHLLEAKTQALMAPDSENGSFVALMHRYGLIGPRSSLAHFVWCTPRDMELAAELGVNVVHNPSSNLFLGSGVQPTARLLSMGVHVALGSDGTASGRANLFEQMRLASLLSRINNIDCDQWINARAALRLACGGGARAMHQDGVVGAITVGAKADITIVDVSVSEHQPLGDIANALVHFETGANVRHVLVNGEIVVRDGRLTTIDERALLEEAVELSIEDARANARNLEIALQERKVFQPLIEKALRQPLPIHRFVGHE